ncbi:MAG: phosphoheptose isomerase [Persephonella sp.]|nr:MAG: phosphoheptose isomerase [Persephonella sp.]RUM59865.1 MAG: phosphoheptose isomerase [Persephonella sp.]
MNVKELLMESIKTKEKILSNEELLNKIEKVADLIVNAYMNDKKVLLCGNGGSAADAQHISAELSGRFKIDRKPLFAEALHVNTSFLTAVANDYSFEKVYERLVEAFGREGDVLIGISTSGNSENIINAVKKAKEIGMITVGFTGKTGGKLKNLVDILINVPSKDTPRIQEAHITIGHIICELVENNLYKLGKI